MARFAGVISVSANGTTVAARGNWVVSGARFVRTGIAGQDAVHGYSELPRVPYIEGDVSTTPDFRLEDFLGITDATIQADLANGVSYVLRGAWQAGEPEINTVDGSVRIRFEGLDCFEVA